MKILQTSGVYAIFLFIYFLNCQSFSGHLVAKTAVSNTLFWFAGSKLRHVHDRIDIVLLRHHICLIFRLLFLIVLPE